MVIYNTFENEIINLNNVIKIKIISGANCVDVMAYFPDNDYSSLIRLDARSQEEKEQSENCAKDIIRNIFNAMSQNKSCFALGETDNLIKDDYIGLTD